MKSSLVIDCNQQQCIYFEPRGENGERLAPREKPHLPDDDGRYYKAIHQYPEIPKTIQKKWRYLHKYSQIIKSKTVKVINFICGNLNFGNPVIYFFYKRENFRFEFSLILVKPSLWKTKTSSLISLTGPVSLLLKQKPSSRMPTEN